MPIWLTTKAHIYNSEGIVSASFGFPLFCGTWSLITLVNGGPWTLCHLGVLSPLLQGTGRKGHLWGDVPVFSHQIFLEHSSLPPILCHPQKASGGSGPSPLFPVALKDPMHLCTSCCTVPRATAAWAFPDCLPHPEARELREHRLPQCSLVGNQKEWQAEGGVRIVVLQMRVGWDGGSRRWKGEGGVTENQWRNG